MAYRTNKIGPWPLVSLDAAVVSLAGATLAAQNFGTLSDIKGWTEDANVLPYRRHMSFRLNGNCVINGGDSVCVGVQIAGTRQQPDRYLLSVAGGILVQCTTGYGVFPVIGRASDTGQVLTVPRWSILPMTGISQLAQMTHASVNVSAVKGDFGVSETASDEEYFAGWVIANYSGGALTIARMVLSISLERYLHDVDVFDPNR